MPGRSAQGVFKDYYCDTIDAAFKEVRQRKSASSAKGIITRFEESPYGGYRVYSVPVETFVDEYLDPVRPRSPSRGFSKRKAVYQ